MKMKIAGISALLAASSLAFAQDRQPPPPPAETAPPPVQQQQPPALPQAGRVAEVSDADLQKFAEIYLAVEQTRIELTQQMNEATDQAEAQQIQARMREEIVSAIDESGWSIEKYDAVATAISNDPELRSQTLELINEMSST